MFLFFNHYNHVRKTFTEALVFPTVVVVSNGGDGLIRLRLAVRTFGKLALNWAYPEKMEHLGAFLFLSEKRINSVLLCIYEIVAWISCRIASAVRDRCQASLKLLPCFFFFAAGGRYVRTPSFWTSSLNSFSGVWRYRRAYGQLLED